MQNPSSQTDDLSRFLDYAWFDGVEHAIKGRIWKALEARAEPVRTALLDQGRPNSELWFVASGDVAIERTDSGRRPEILTELSGPAIFGTTTFFRNSVPTMTIRTTSSLEGWTLARTAYDQLRTDDPAAAEVLALMVVKVLSERFDMLDNRLTSLMADHQGDHRRVTEWADFRSRLFEEPAA